MCVLKNCLSFVILSQFLCLTNAGPDVDYTYVKGDDGLASGYYKAHYDTRTWLDAHQVCNSEGAALLIPNKVELQYVRVSLNLDVMLWIWIDASDTREKGHFETLDGRPVKSWTSKMNEGLRPLLPFKRDLPNSHCVLVSPYADTHLSSYTDSWWTGPCDYYCAFICKYDAAVDRERSYKALLSNKVHRATPYIALQLLIALIMFF